tara:strand:- start:111 stop:632 length:522 start_codon:yes stop_codon:yes gene_type:complete
MIRIDEGWISFQEYFVRRRCEPKVIELDYRNISDASSNPDAILALESADIIVLAPSNPFLSLLPILKIPAINSTIIRKSHAPKIAVSPLISGKAIKGPADKLMNELGFVPDSSGICELYKDFLDVLIIDNKDVRSVTSINRGNVQVRSTDILMNSIEKKMYLASFIIEIASEF